MTEQEQKFFLENLGKSFEEFKKEADNKKSGYYSTAASSGNSSKAASSGNYSTAASSGGSSTAASSGNYSTAASSGNFSKAASSGNFSKAASSGNYSTAASSGNSSKAECDGDFSSAAANGFFATVKGEKNGSIISAIEFNKDQKPIGAAWAKIGDNAEKGKEYIAYNGVLKEMIIVDGIKSILLSKKKNCLKVIDSNFKELYVVSDSEGNNAHGKTIKEARENLVFKVTDRDKSEFEGLTVDSVLTLKEALTAYRAVTGACHSGMKSFIESKGIKKKSYKVSEIIDATKDAYGGKEFKNFIDSNKK